MTRTLFSTLILFAHHSPGHAAEWKDPSPIQINAEPHRASFTPFSNREDALKGTNRPEWYCLCDGNPCRIRPVGF